MLLSGDILESDLGGQDGTSKGRDQQNEIADCCLHSIKDSHCFEADFFLWPAKMYLGRDFHNVPSKPAVNQGSGDAVRSGQDCNSWFCRLQLPISPSEECSSIIGFWPEHCQ